MNELRRLIAEQARDDTSFVRPEEGAISLDRVIAQVGDHFDIGRLRRVVRGRRRKPYDKERYRNDPIYRAKQIERSRQWRERMKHAESSR